MVRFREKEYSILSDTISGAKVGGAIGALGAPVLGRMNGGKFTNKNSNDPAFVKKSLMVTGGGILLGAALGMLVGTVKAIGTSINRADTVDDRLLNDVVEKLGKNGVNKDFTRDPKIANELKTKVCLVISKYSDDLRILINTVNDPKLKAITDVVVKEVPRGSIKTNTGSNKYNEITLSTLSSGKDASVIAEIAKAYIQKGYPVYLVEVG